MQKVNFIKNFFTPTHSLLIGIDLLDQNIFRHVLFRSSDFFKWFERCDLLCNRRKQLIEFIFINF